MQEPNKLVLSKTVTITTRTKIDGEVYDASKIFGVTQTGNNSIQLFPDITVNALQISDHSNETRNCARDIINHNNFDPCIFLSEIIAPGLPMTNAFMDFGILNFTSRRINDELEFKAVDLKEVEKTTTSLYIYLNNNNNNNNKSKFSFVFLSFNFKLYFFFLFSFFCYILLVVYSSLEKK